MRVSCGVFLPASCGDHRLLNIDYTAAAADPEPAIHLQRHESTVSLLTGIGEIELRLPTCSFVVRLGRSMRSCLPAAPQHLSMHRNATIVSHSGALAVYAENGTDITPDLFQQPLSQQLTQLAHPPLHLTAPKVALPGSYYLWSTSHWASNFEHLMTQYVPKLVDYLRLCDVYQQHAATPPRLLLPMQNRWVDQIINSLGLDAHVMPLNWSGARRYRVQNLFLQRAYTTDSITPASVELFRRQGTNAHEAARISFLLLNYHFLVHIGSYCYCITTSPGAGGSGVCRPLPPSRV